MINEKTYEKISIPAMGGNRESAWEEFAEKEYQSPRWGAIAAGGNLQRLHVVSIPAMGGNSGDNPTMPPVPDINPRDGGQ